MGFHLLGMRVSNVQTIVSFTFSGSNDQALKRITTKAEP